ncbi:MAG: hypothetical protein U5L96_09675 [Owenweeksia sp.]|nr:hypothetical protein [Owenweeksia sp.]
MKSLDSKELFQAWTEIIRESDTIVNYRKVSSAIDFLSGTKHEISRIYFVHNERIYQKLTSAKLMIDHVPDQAFFSC